MTTSADTILILGMHRSGTSCLAGSLEAAGLHLGEVFTANPHNRKGNRENARVMALNSAVLQYSEGDWDKPPAALRWTDEHRRERDAIIKLLRQGNAPHWGFKDPRLTFTLPFWQEAIESPRLVASFRHPDAVAASLAARNQFSREFAIALWTAYNAELLNYLQAAPLQIACFDVCENQYLQDIERLCRSLCLSPSQEPSFFDAQLRNQQANAAPGPLPDETAAVYTRLMAYYQDRDEPGSNDA